MNTNAKKITPAILLILLFLVNQCHDPGKEIENGPLPEDEGPDTTGVVGVGILHAKGVQLQALNVISSSNLNPAQRVLVSTLQGLAAKISSEQIYIDEGGPGSVWKNHLATEYNVSLKDHLTWGSLLRRYKSLVDGYILYDKTIPKSLTAATSLCGPMNAIAVDKSLQSEVISAGITGMKADVRNRDEKWVYENYKSHFTKKMVAELDPALNHHLRDYATMTNAFTFYDGITSWRMSVLQDLEPEAFNFGYYAADEFNMVDHAAVQGVVMLPAEAPNLSALSSVYPTKEFQQATYSTPVTEENVHYVTFLISDGDNIGFDLWTLQSYFSNPVRGSFNVGYTISPSLVDLAPTVLDWYYQKASKGTHKDFFVAGPSGSGYTFPSRLPEPDLDSYLNRLDMFMQNADMNIVNILDQGAYNRLDVWNKFLAKPSIDALLYTGYGEAPQGRISLSENGKPIIESRDNLWEGLEDEQTVITNINSRPATPDNAAGYTMVFVHVWTKDLSDIKTVVDGLGPNVRVVTPDAFVKLIKENVTAENSGGSVATIEDGSTYKILNYKSGLSLDVGAVSQEDGADVIQWSYNGGDNQQWMFTALGADEYKITATHSDKVLQVEGTSLSEGAIIEQSTWINAAHQIWKLKSNGDGTYHFTNKHSNLVLDVNGGSLSNGASVRQSGDTNSTSQKWIIQLP